MKEGEFAFTHSILFNGGVELQLTFFHLSCRHLNWAFPPGQGLDPEAALIPFAEGQEAPLSPRWKQPRFLPLPA